MEEASSPLSLQLHQGPTQQAPLPPPASSPSSNPTTKKSLITSLMEAATTLRSPSFKEDTYFISHLKPSEKKSLQDLKSKLTATYNDESSKQSLNPTMWNIPFCPATKSPT
ncbi:hypothetical protein Nepgr_028388 [Nepenthes gracilis]|uniref:Uncharacterized protein n=1 Tax=Nepenthes gracilis TaxID=150966 RepID=A0AAD3TBL2_NEPGR|nr:hypothetical protein Nepgr_028388 [Nepenthes gracilis]